MRSVSLHGVLRMTLVALALLLPSLAATQETQQKVNGKAVVRGTVTDATGAVVTAASVVVSNGTGARRKSRPMTRALTPSPISMRGLTACRLLHLTSRSKLWITSRLPPASI